MQKSHPVFAKPAGAGCAEQSANPLPRHKYMSWLTQSLNPFWMADDVCHLHEPLLAQPLAAVQAQRGAGRKPEAVTS